MEFSYTMYSFKVYMLILAMQDRLVSVLTMNTDRYSGAHQTYRVSNTLCNDEFLCKICLVSLITMFVFFNFHHQLMLWCVVRY